MSNFNDKLTKTDSDEVRAWLSNYIPHKEIDPCLTSVDLY